MIRPIDTRTDVRPDAADPGYDSQVPKRVLILGSTGSIGVQALDVVDRSADLVLCDMAPNISGVASADQAGSIHLAELALDLAQQVLKPGGDFVVKVFQGEGSDAYLRQLRAAFTRLAVRKPAASRSRSREVYAVARGLRSGLRESGARD